MLVGFDALSLCRKFPILGYDPNAIQWINLNAWRQKISIGSEVLETLDPCCLYGELKKKGA